MLTNSFAAFQNRYEPAFATRIGLRYINVFPVLFFKEHGFTCIREVIRDPFCGPIGHLPLETDTIEEFSSKTLYKYDELTKYRVIGSVGYDQLTNDKVFVIDTDVFSQVQNNMNVVSDHLENFHNIAFDCFLWTLQDGITDLFNE